MSIIHTEDLLAVTQKIASDYLRKDSATSIYQPIISDLSTIRSNAATAYGWGNHAGLYLPLTGGTLPYLELKSGYDRKLMLNNTDGEKWSLISFQENGTEVGILGLRGSNDLVWNTNIVLHSGNYSSYAQPIATAINTSNIGLQSVYSASKITMPLISDLDIWESNYNQVGFYENPGSTNGAPDGYPYGYLQNFRWNNGAWSGQVYYTVSDFGSEIFTRGYYQSQETWTSWKRFLNSENYSSYALPLSGGTMTGTAIFSSVHWLDSSDGKAYLAYAANNLYLCATAGAIHLENNTGSDVYNRINNVDYKMWDARNLNPASIDSVFTTSQGYRTLDLRGYDEDTWFPCSMPLGADHMTEITIWVALNSNVPSWATHSAGFSMALRWEVNGFGWGTIPLSRTIKCDAHNHTVDNVSPCGGITQNTQYSYEIVFLRGGAVYYYHTSDASSITPHNGTYVVGSEEPYRWEYPTRSVNEITATDNDWTDSIFKVRDLSVKYITASSGLFNGVLTANDDIVANRALTVNGWMRLSQSGGIYTATSEYGSGDRKIYGWDSLDPSYPYGGMMSYAMIPDNDYNDGWQIRRWNGDRSNAVLTALHTGYVGIGKINPEYTLDLIGTGVHISTSNTCGIEMASTHSECSVSYAPNGSSYRSVLGAYTDRFFLWNSVIGEHVSVMSDNGQVKLSGDLIVGTSSNPKCVFSRYIVDYENTSLTLQPWGGNVGIGVTYPGCTLDLGNDGQIHAMDIGYSPASDYWNDGAANHPWYGLSMAGVAHAVYNFNCVVLSGYYGLHLKTGDTNLMLYNGGVGVDEYMPLYKLDVKGDIRSQERVYIGTSGAYLWYDAANNCIRTNVNFAADGDITAGA